MKELSEKLTRVVESAETNLRRVSEAESNTPVLKGGWSRKQIIGHLIDSASNNHQRFVRAQQGSSFSFPPYEQNHWVASQHYNDRAWSDLVSMWHAYNAHLSHVIGHIADAHLAVPCVIESSNPVTLEFLVTD